MRHERLEPAHEPMLNWFKMICPKRISADDLIESLGLPLLLRYDVPCDFDKSLEVAVEHSMWDEHLELALGWIEMVWPKRILADVFIAPTQ